MTEEHLSIATVWFITPCSTQFLQWCAVHCTANNRTAGSDI